MDRNEEHVKDDLKKSIFHLAYSAEQGLLEEGSTQY
jgi:hypothetical protein